MNKSLLVQLAFTTHFRVIPSLIRLQYRKFLTLFFVLFGRLGVNYTNENSRCTKAILECQIEAKLFLVNVSSNTIANLL